jgi:hypothetical protein
VCWGGGAWTDARARLLAEVNTPGGRGDCLAVTPVLSSTNAGCLHLGVISLSLSEVNTGVTLVHKPMHPQLSPLMVKFS